MTTKPTRGGSRPGSGAKKKPPGEKRIKVAISMRPDLYEVTKGNRSGLIEEALELWIDKENELWIDRENELFRIAQEQLIDEITSK